MLTGSPMMVNSMRSGEPMKPWITSPVCTPMPIWQVMRPLSRRAFFTHLARRLLECERGLRGLFEVPGMGFGAAEDDEERVADELVDRAVVAENAIDHRREVVVQEQQQVVGIHLGGHGGEAANIRAENRDIRAFPTQLQASALRAADEMSADLWREVGHQPLEDAYPSGDLGFQFPVGEDQADLVSHRCGQEQVLRRELGRDAAGAEAENAERAAIGHDRRIDAGLDVAGYLGLAISCRRCQRKARF